jgi:hypothetical protein
MSTGILIILTLLLLAVLGVLGMGVIGMIRDGGANPQRSNKLMRWRVILQGIAVLLLFLVLATQG